MRAYAIVAIVLVLACAIPAIAAPLAIQRSMDRPGWYVDRFTMTGDRVNVIIGTDAGEVSGGIIHLYNGAGAPLRSSAYVILGGNSPDVLVSAGGASAGTDTLLSTERDPRAVNVGFLCNAACNPSREFIVATSGAGTNLTAWGFMLFGDGVARISNASGSTAGAVATRHFDGLGAHAGVGSEPGTSLRGLNVAQGATLQVSATRTFAGGFARFAGAEPTTMALQTPTGTMECPCVVRNGAAGAYAFRYDNAAATSDEAYAVWADLTLT